MGEGDHDAAGEVFADLDGDLVRAGIGGDVESVDADGFADRFEHVRAGPAREADDSRGELYGFHVVDLGDVFVKED